MSSNLFNFGKIDTLTKTPLSIVGIKDRIWKKLQGWKDKSAGKVLIMAITQSIPTFGMSCFKRPIYFCMDIKKIVINFWWGASNEKKGIPW